jgi:hypothetical protein
MAARAYRVGMRILAFLPVAALALGCPSEAVRSVTYPPSFQYIEGDRLHGTMWKMAAAVQQLDEVLRADGLPAQDRQTSVTQLLADIDDAASRVSAPGQNTNHPMLDRNLARFQLDLALAKSAVAETPPNFAPATRITGACLYCHVGTGGGPLQH